MYVRVEESRVRGGAPESDISVEKGGMVEVSKTLRVGTEGINQTTNQYLIEKTPIISHFSKKKATYMKNLANH